MYPNPVAAAAKSSGGRPAPPAISQADRAAYERDVNMATEVYDGSGSIDAETIAIYSHIPVPMRDGTVLYADLYRPATPGRYPTLISRTPYNHEHMKTDHLRWAQEGFAYLEMYVRGRIESVNYSASQRVSVRRGLYAHLHQCVCCSVGGKVGAVSQRRPGWIRCN